MIDQAFIETLLSDYDADLPHLECDGFTRVAHYTLHINGVPHRCYVGTCTVNGRTVDPHFWIQYESLIIDYRLRCWAGQDAPHGVFAVASYPQVQYKGDEVDLNVTKVIFDILTEKRKTKKVRLAR